MARRPVRQQSLGDGIVLGQDLWLVSETRSRRTGCFSADHERHTYAPTQLCRITKESAGARFAKKRLAGCCGQTLLNCGANVLRNALAPEIGRSVFASPQTLAFVNAPSVSVQQATALR